MSQACCPNPESTPTAVESCCELHPPIACGPTTCPACGALGRPVKRLTLGALLTPAARARIPRQEEFCFCRTATCDVVYFRPGEALFRQADLSVDVGLKEPHQPSAPVCYCFGWTPQKIRAEIEATDKSTVIEQIKAQVKAGNCYCEVTNPQGSCCLGNVAKAVQEAIASFSKKDQ
ncbi:MAG: copper chaperone Copz family protein [Candidatus Omnitrophica bacterium]|nr:copper chaperone Copz family protein [Candidatus Omnitrophota bacterium]